MDNDQFNIRAKNVLALVQSGGTVDQVAEVMRDVHRSAIEMVAEDFADRAASVMRQQSADPNLYQFYQRQVQHVRSLKNGGTNI